ncbi:Aluminum-activated malate transporter 12, partial [Mucuna pruriens]
MAETNYYPSNRSMTSHRIWKYMNSVGEKVKRYTCLAWKTAVMVGKEDPRRVVHSLKVGLALTLVSLLYLIKPLFEGIGQNAMSAVLTVVVVMEFTVGATLGKGLNRGLGTMLAGSLAFLVEYVADIPGRIFQAVFIGFAVFILGATTTYVRFIPHIKKNYDYGVMIFLLTFNLITVSSYRVDNVWAIAKDRIATIAIGGGLCLVMSLLVFPNWSGEDLHNSTISKLEGIANSIEETQDDPSEDLIYKGYMAVLDSRAKDETLKILYGSAIKQALQASWEPRWSRHWHRIPWRQYIRVGTALRQFSYTVVALHGCLLSEIETPGSIRALYRDSCIKLAEEVSKALRELANNIRNKRQFSSQVLSDNINKALQNLNDDLKSQPQLFLGSKSINGGTTHPEEDTRVSFSSVRSDCSSMFEYKSKELSGEVSMEGQKKVLKPLLSKIAMTSLEFSEALPFAAFTSMLVEMVAKLDHVIDAVENLAKLSCFRQFRDDDDKILALLEVSMAETNTSNSSTRQLSYIYSVADKVKRFPGLAGRATWKVGKEDPRRVVHSLKVGMALTLVSLLYLMEPLFKGIGKNAMWAVMTVVVVMEFTVGATLSKGLNRGLGTLLAGSLAFLIEYLANAPGRIFRALLIGAAVFLIGAMTTYVRFIPYIKKNYDYGVVIFLLTFNLITVSSYRIDHVWDIAKDRMSTIAIGCGICLVMSLLVFPNWSGEDLHNNTISKLEGLANSIQVCVVEYFYDSAKPEETRDDSSEDPIYQGYKAVLDSKASDETLALQASWEPRYSRSCHRIPWNQYARVGAALRYFSYTVVALHGCLQSEIQTPKSIRALYKGSCIRLAEEVSKVLRELANSIRDNRQFSPQKLSNNLKEALQDLDNALKSQPQLVLGSRNGRSTSTSTNTVEAVPPQADQKLEEDSRMSLSSVRNDSFSPRGCKSKEHSREQLKKVLRPQLSKIAIVSLQFSEALPFAAFTSLLVELVAKLDRVMDEVEELGRMAHFREFKDDDGDEIVVTCDKPKMNMFNMAESNASSNRNSRLLRYIHSFADKAKRFPGLARRETWKVGKDDPRKVVHALKVGIALTLVSLLYLMEPLFKGIGSNTMWAVMTVVVVMEFTVGAMTTYVRFIPYIKKKYDYGVVIFLLTFNLITVSSYRIDHVWIIAKDRIYTIAIGCGICLVMTLLVFPNWSGENLHNNTISKLEGLAKSIEVCAVEYFYDSAKSATQDDSSEDLIYEGYKAILDSKASDETLALQASWEPRYSRYCHTIPWHQYTRVGAALRHFSYTVVALHGCVRSEIQAPKSIRSLYKGSCMRLAEEVSNVLKELADSIRNNRKFSSEALSNILNEALQELEKTLKSQPQLLLGPRNGRSTSANIPVPQPEDQIKKILRPQLSMNMTAIISLEFSDALPFAAFTSLLVELVAKLDHVVDEVEKLGRMAHFKEFKYNDIVVTCDKPKSNVHNNLPSYGIE